MIESTTPAGRTARPRPVWRMMPVALMASHKCGSNGVAEQFFRPRQDNIGGAGWRAVWRGRGAGVEDFAANRGERAAEAFGHERLRMPREPRGGGFGFQQIGDCWKRSKQVLFLVRHVIGSCQFWRAILPTIVGAKTDRSQKHAGQKQELLRALPAITELLKSETAAAWLPQHPQPLVTECLRRALAACAGKFLRRCRARPAARQPRRRCRLALAEKFLRDAARTACARGHQRHRHHPAHRPGPGGSPGGRGGFHHRRS